MKAERSGTNMQTVTWAVNRPLGVLHKDSFDEGDSPTAWHLYPAYTADMRMPPAWNSSPLISEAFRPVNLQGRFPR